MRADLHVHSTASDGTLTPAELVSLALERRVDVLAIADHDSVEGVAEAKAAAAGTGLVIIPAVELSAVGDGVDVHVLAYFIDPAVPALLEMLAKLRESRLRRARGMVEALAAAGYAVSLDQVLEFSNGGSVGRSHLARALVHAGHADSVRDAFARFIGRGRPFYRPKESPSPSEVVAAVLALGAVPVLAHPAIGGADALYPELLAAGLMGIEAYHADHTPEQRAHHAAIAAREGLIVTGGSDYHGPEAPSPELGSVELPPGAVESLLKAGIAPT